MEDSIAGGMYGALSIAGRHERRADREYVVAFAPWHGFQTINGRAFVGNTPVYEARVGETVQWDVMAMGDEFHTFHVHGHKWRTDGGTPEDTRGLGPAESFRVRWTRGRAGHLALPLPRRDAHGAGHDRPLPGEAMSAPRSRSPRPPPPLALRRARPPPRRRAIAMPGKYFDPRALTSSSPATASRSATPTSSRTTCAIAGGVFDSGPMGRGSRRWAQALRTRPASTRSSARCTRS